MKRKRIYNRPDKVRQYGKQREFIDNEERFTVVEATTKAGKTSGCIVWLFEQALRGKEGDNYWWVAPIYAVAKIAFRRMKRYISKKNFYTANASEHSITLKTGAVLYFKSAENPDTLYGDDVRAVVIDEGTRVKEDSWLAVFTTLTATMGRCKIIGNVKGIDNWVYRLAREAEKGLKPNWKYFKITAADAVAAGILKQEAIDEAERTLARDHFLELYYAIPFVNTSNKFAFAFDPAKHVGPTKYDPTQYLYLSFDFNRNPISCTAFQHYGGKIYAIKCFKLMNSNIEALCDLIAATFPNASIIVNGDATGSNGTALVKDNLNFYTVIKRKLNLGESAFKVPKVNPGIGDNQVLVNAILANYPLQIDPTECAPLIYDLQFVEMLPDGSIKKGDRKDPKQQADFLDGFRYYLNMNFKGFLKYGKAA